MHGNRRTDTTYACPVVGRRELDRQQRAHRERLQKMKSALDTRAPAPQPHLTLYGRDYVAKKRATTEAAFSDLKMIQAIARTMTRDHSIPERKGPISLNADGRKQEIYRIMKDNHRLLESIESCEPMMRTQDMVKADQFRKRYIINSSHSMRLSGEYEDEMQRIREEERRKRELQQSRLDKSRRMYNKSSAGSVSLPSLSPNGQRGAATEKPPSPPSKKAEEAASSSSHNREADSGYPSSAPPQQQEQGVDEPQRAVQPEQQREFVDTEPPAASQSATNADEAVAMPEQRPPVRFDIEEIGGDDEAEAASVQRRQNRIHTPHVGSINLDDFQDDEDLEDAREAKQQDAAEDNYDDTNYDETFEAEDQTFEDDEGQ